MRKLRLPATIFVQLLIVFCNCKLQAQNVNYSPDRQVVLDWKMDSRLMTFPGAIYPPQFNGLPAYSFVWPNGNSPVGFTLSNEVFKPLEGSILTPAQIKAIESQIITTQTIG